MMATTARLPLSEDTDAAKNKNDAMQIDHPPQQQQLQSQPIIDTYIIKPKQKKQQREYDIENITMKDTNLKIVQIPEKIDATHVKIFEEGSSSSSLDNMLGELEDEDFEISVKDFQRISAYQKQKDQQEDEQKLFFSRKQNQPGESIVCTDEKNRKEYKAALIRVRLGSYILQGTFSPDNTLLSVIQMIKAVVEPFDFPICLYQSPPVKRFEDPSKTLRELSLIPAAVINISYPTLQTTNDKQQSKPALSIKQEFKQYIQSFGDENFPCLGSNNEKDNK